VNLEFSRPPRKRNQVTPFVQTPGSVRFGTSRNAALGILRKDGLKTDVESCRSFHAGVQNRQPRRTRQVS
jgi:hypothetical protein